MRQECIEHGREQPQCSVDIEHELEREDLFHSERGQSVGRCRGQRTRCDRERADEAVAREDARALPVGHAPRHRGLFQRDMHADVSGRRIDRADEGDERDEDEMRGGGEGYSGRDHQPGARQEKRAQITTRSNQSDCEREHGGAEQRSGSDNSDLNRPKPER